MAKHTGKEQLIKDIETAHRQLEKAIAGFNRRDMSKRGVVGEWSIKDLLAHLSAWEQLCLHWYRTGLRGEIPQVPAPGMSKKRINLLNQRIFEQHSNLKLEEVKTEFDRSHQEILALVLSIREEELFAAGRYAWTGKLRLVDYIAANTCNHYRWARSHMRKWVKASKD